MAEEQNNTCQHRSTNSKPAATTRTRRPAAAGQPVPTSECNSHQRYPTSPSLSPVTPTNAYSKKNKRKMSAPQKRTDFSIKRFCLQSGDSMSEDDDDEDKKKRMRRLRKSSSGAPSSNSEQDSEEGPRESPNSSTNSDVSLQRDGPTPVLLAGGGLGPVISVPMVWGQMPPHHHLMLMQQQVQAQHAAAVAAGQLHHHQQLQKKSEQDDCGDASDNALSPSAMSSSPSPKSNSGIRKPRKNYKNMTRERRVEANARERTRVHTISAAFENLRRAVPSYSYNQRLSKLAILKIACSYIVALSRLADMDYSSDQSSPSFKDCVDLCTETIQAEGKAKRRH